MEVRIPTSELGDIVEQRTGKTAGRKDPSMPYVGLESINTDSPDLVSVGKADESVSTNSVFATDDVLFGKLRPNLRKCVLAPFPGYCSTDIIVLRARKSVCPRFAAKLLQSDAVFSEAIRTAFGTKMPRTSWSTLSRLSLFCPAEPEQRRIAEILDTIDEVIRRTEQVIEKLQQMKQGLLHDLLTRGIDDNGELRPPPEEAPHLYKDSPLGLIPKDWNVQPFHHLSESLDPQPDHRTPPHIEGGLPYIGVGDFASETVLDLERCRRVSERVIKKQEERFNIAQGDIIFGKIGTIGSPRFVPTNDRIALSANVILMKPKVNPEFVMGFLSSNLVALHIEELTHTTSQPAFGIMKARSMLAPIPPTQELEQVSCVLGESHQRTATEHRELGKLRTLKKGLMDDLLSGRVRVHMPEGEC